MDRCPFRDFRPCDKCCKMHVYHLNENDAVVYSGCIIVACLERLAAPNGWC